MKMDYSLRLKHLFNQYDKIKTLTDIQRIKLFSNMLLELSTEPCLKVLYDEILDDLIQYHRYLLMSNNYDMLYQLKQEFIGHSLSMETPRLHRLLFIPQNIYTNPQNVHSFTSSTLKAIARIIDTYPAIYERPFDHPFFDAIESSDVILKHGTQNIRAFDVFASVFRFISSHKDKDELLKRLKEEMDESMHMCLLSHVTRMLNSIRGFEGSIDIEVDEYEREKAIFFHRMNALVDIDIDSFVESVANIVNDQKNSVFHQLRQCDFDLELINDYSKQKWTKHDDVYRVV